MIDSVLIPSKELGLLHFIRGSINEIYVYKNIGSSGLASSNNIIGKNVVSFE